MTTKITVPSSDINRNMDLNMSEITYAEGRLDEIATVNTHKAPELMSCFVKAYTWCVEHVTNLTAESVKAETAANFRKAEIILEEVPRVLKEKGITGKSNEDYRNAVIAMDKAHIALRERFNHIEMYRELFKGKLKSIELAYMAVRKIYGSGMDFRNPNLGSNHTQDPWSPPPQMKDGDRFQVTVDAPYVSSATTPTTTQSTIRAGFGKAKEY